MFGKKAPWWAPLAWLVLGGGVTGGGLVAKDRILPAPPAAAEDKLQAFRIDLHEREIVGVKAKDAEQDKAAGDLVRKVDSVETKVDDVVDVLREMAPQMGVRPPPRRPRGGGR